MFNSTVLPNVIQSAPQVKLCDSDSVPLHTNGCSYFLLTGTWNIIRPVTHESSARKTLFMSVVWSFCTWGQPRASQATAAAFVTVSHSKTEEWKWSQSCATQSPRWGRQSFNDRIRHRLRSFITVMATPFSNGTKSVHLFLWWGFSVRLLRRRWQTLKISTLTDTSKRIRCNT